MMQPTFIAALPRSRTAWFATLLTWDTSIVGHDLPLPQLLDSIASGRITGHSCASNLLAWRQLHTTFPTAKWAVIERDFMASYRSSKNAFPTVNYGSFAGLQRELDDLKRTLNPLTIPYTSINLDTCYMLADYLGTKIGPQQRVTQLLDMQIQIHPQVLATRIAALSKEAA